MPIFNFSFSQLRNLKQKNAKNMKILRKTLVVCFIMATFSMAATTNIDGNEIYLDVYLKVTKNKNSATYYCTLEETTNQGYHFKAYFLSGELKMDGWYVDEEMTIENGLFTYFYKSGQIESVGEYSHGMKVGIWKRFDANGNEKPEKIYQSQQVMEALEEANKAK